MDANGVKRRDTTKGPPLRILSLDGGGVRGYSMLIIIQELMHRTFVETEGRAPRRHEIPKPCDHFDLIFGTGTGGLIALMLGRLRLDLETCKELYVQMTRIVFETDKTIAGIPYRSTLFKASKLEDAIKQAVREHTASETEGNDGAHEEDLVNPLNSARYSSAGREPRRHASNASTVSFSARSPSAQMRPFFHGGRGDPNASLYDHRENRTKTALTAIYKGSPRGAPPCILRSYDSRHEPAPEFDCKIWQAGRATCAVGLAFKPVSIGQSIFHDDGVGTFNPSPEALDEAVVKEWPGREVGVFVSIGTGRRPKGSDANQHVWYEGFLGEFAEARRKLISKIEGCEKIHEHMMRDLLIKRGVNVENYYRLNVEVGVGEFGMNEWHRLGEISTSTRRYMAKGMEQQMIHGISSKLSKILKAKIRWERALSGVPELVKTTSSTGFETPFAVELPGDTPDPSPGFDRMSQASFESGQDSLQHDVPSHSPRTSLDPNARFAQQYADPSDKFLVQGQSQHRYNSSAGSSANGDDKIAITSPDEMPRPPVLPPRSSEFPQSEFIHPLNAPPQTRMEPPPLPPKTPLPENQRRSEDNRRSVMIGGLPYPIDDEAPPAVNMARKPDFRGR